MLCNPLVSARGDIIPLIHGSGPPNASTTRIIATVFTAPSLQNKLRQIGIFGQAADLFPNIGRGNIHDGAGAIAGGEADFFQQALDPAPVPDILPPVQPEPILPPAPIQEPSSAPEV